MTEVEKAWLAALVDGEGCISITSQHKTGRTHPSYTIVVRVAQVKSGMVDYAREITGVGSRRFETSARRANARDQYSWTVKSRQAAQVLRQIRPYLILKGSQSDLAVILQHNIDNCAFGRGREADPKTMAWRQWMKSLMHVLNRRGVEALQ